jgi:hypothetical protein
LATNEVVHNNWKRAIEIKDEINKVTLQDANNAFKKYITNITWVYQGDPKKVDSKLYVQKENTTYPGGQKSILRTILTLHDVKLQ